MQLYCPALALLFFFALSACRAADPTPATAPASDTLHATVTISSVATNVFAQIRFTNTTAHPLSLGHYSSFTLTRTDTTPPSQMSASPKDAMTPHFRLLIKPGESRSITVPLWEKATALPPGRYHATVDYPKDVVPGPLEADFTFPLDSTTAPAK